MFRKHCVCVCFVCLFGVQRDCTHTLTWHWTSKPIDQSSRLHRCLRLPPSTMSNEFRRMRPQCHVEWMHTTVAMSSISFIFQFGTHIEDIELVRVLCMMLLLLPSPLFQHLRRRSIVRPFVVVLWRRRLLRAILGKSHSLPLQILLLLQFFPSFEFFRGNIECLCVYVCALFVT